MFGVNWSCPRPTFMQIRTVAGIQHVCERHCSWFFTQEVHCESTHFARDSHQFSKFMPRDKFFSNNLTRHFHGIFNRFSPGFNRILPSVTPFPRVFCRCTATILKARWLCSKARATVHQGADVLLEKGHVFFWKIAWKKGALHSLLKMNMNEIILMGYEWDIMGH